MRGGGVGGAVVAKDESVSELQQTDVAVKRAGRMKEGAICSSDRFAVLLLKHWLKCGGKQHFG